jgi:hypothetical protein
MNDNVKVPGIWRWVAITLIGAAVSGISFTAGIQSVSGRLVRLEHTTVSIQERQDAMSARLDQHRLDVVDQLNRIEIHLDRLMDHLVSGR